jgi:cystathionine gamma-synthase
MAERDETIAATAGLRSDDTYNAVMPPLYLSAAFGCDETGARGGYDYARTAHPNRDHLAEALSALEGGAGAVIASSGMAAVDLVLSLLPAGALVVAPHDCYGGTWRLLSARARKGTIEVLFVDQTDEAALAAVLLRAPALVWIETPSNPLLRVVDIARVAAAAHEAGAKVAVDNTLLSPMLQKPIELGADFVVHSTTKYINGHSDVVGGAVIAARAEDVEQLKWWANCCGVTGSPFDAWLTSRGLRTLPARIERQQRTATRIADWLSRHPAVAAVHYPGLESHPGHKLAARQQRGFGAILSFEVATLSAHALLARVKRFIVAQSLGGVESLISHPATMTHASMTPAARASAGISDNLLRASIGLEHEDDLVADLASALEQVPS